MEIIILIFLIIYIVRLAKRKGEPPFKWAIRCVLAWMAGEITGIAIIFTLVGQDLFYSVIVGYGTAYLFFLLLKSSLDSRPDINEAGIS
jgi:hypothetical protein